MKSKYIFTAILLVVGLGVAGCNDVLDKKKLERSSCRGYME